MRILFLALGDRRVASSRIRAWNFASALSRLGYHSSVVVGPSWQGIRAILQRRWDIIVIQKWAAPAPIVLLLRLVSRVLVFDCDDAIYLREEAANRTSRHAKRNSRRLRLVIRLCDRFTVSTSQMASDFSKLRPKTPCLVFPGPMPGEREDVVSPSERVGMVWLGSPATEQYLWPYVGVLERMAVTGGFVAIGGSAESLRRGIQVIDWTEQSEAEELGRSAFGLFVQPDGPWERRKSGYKVLEYVASGVLPIVEGGNAVDALIPVDYPFRFESSGDGKALADVLNVAGALSIERRTQICTELSDYMRARFSYESVVRRWLSFLELSLRMRIQGSESTEE